MRGVAQRLLTGYLADVTTGWEVATAVGTIAGAIATTAAVVAALVIAAKDRASAQRGVAQQIAADRERAAIDREVELLLRLADRIANMPHGQPHPYPHLLAARALLDALPDTSGLSTARTAIMDFGRFHNGAHVGAAVEEVAARIKAIT